MSANDLNFERCYRAVATRDSRFDGQFVTAVRTTGIYCRPSCPAITPKPANVTFLPTAAAAQQCGYRACRRCLPDAAPGSPLWNTRADLAARAMRLIGDGVIERGGVPALADALGYSQRQLTRVLTSELGAGPLALARAHRAHTARLLIQTTRLPMSDIAFAAGFASIRQFNDTVREVFAVSPTTLREESRRRNGDTLPTTNGLLTLRLPYREPLDKPWLEWFLAAHTTPGLETWEDGVYTRSLRTPHGHTTVRLSVQPGHVRATLALHDMRDLAPTVARLRHFLDLDADPVGIDEALAAGLAEASLRPHPSANGSGPGLGLADGAATRPASVHALTLSPGIRVPGCLDASELLLRTMIGQQISVAAANTHTSRLVQHLGESITGPIPHLFPTPAAIAEHGAEVLTGPTRRIEAIVAAARALAQGDLVLHAGRTPTDLRRDLLALDGVGPWTADYVTMRLLADPDILLHTDLVVRRGAGLLGIDLTDTGRWSPWRSYLSMHLWKHALANPAPAPDGAAGARKARTSL
ncbi:DNA-3-methyladenine glycosylase 2 family protein [Nocardia huaxiensis]|uniref:DNA-3-methyladenine glycosylase II n=1 Tax=Nocardia huaxiensis TaxID=2755382 RepID=A0A7D6VH79_9NOCA|nr:AlkA N-terminal domain-containing protein [Nocardia huaxiensis]QLY32737.1 DNA-3-methyladenine glycosylase 2 family protein [Nocardia huaxiensis]